MHPVNNGSMQTMTIHVKLDQLNARYLFARTMSRATISRFFSTKSKILRISKSKIFQNFQNLSDFEQAGLVVGGPSALV